MSSSEGKFNICMVCDFFYPNLGGVEMHIFQLSLCLIERGHKVIVITRPYGDRKGVRYLTKGLKVYYVPLPSFYPIVDQITLPTFFGFLPLFRQIMIRERIQILHAHQASSISGLECILHAKTMGLKTVFTDHSLFSLGDAAGINLNKVIKFFFSDLDHAISVSHTSRENLSLRASLNPHLISVIPNAVDTSRFRPDPSKRYPVNTINIVVMSRLTYRKGVDFLVDVIPEICNKFPQAYFIIGGDGPKRILLEHMIQANNLQNRVEMLGSVPHKEVRNVLVRGHIFLNTSLTEAFCIAIVEAASSGLFVVSTNVGGVREVLPKEMVLLSNPNPAEITEKLSIAIENAGVTQTHGFHAQIKQMYSWRDVSERTEKIYNKIMQNPKESVAGKIKKFYSCGPYAGLFLVMIVALDHIFYLILSLLFPSKKIEKAVDFPFKEYLENAEKSGNHNFDVFEIKKC